MPRGLLRHTPQTNAPIKLGSATVVYPPATVTRTPTQDVLLSVNQPLNNWDVSNVIDMYNMFENATSFNQPLHAP